MGKTNILDAIYYLCLTRSNFGRTDKNNVMHGEDFFRITGDFTRNSSKSKVAVKLPLEGQKSLEMNGKIVPRMLEHIGKFPVVMIAPKDNVQILESSAERRKLIDRVLSQVNIVYLKDLMAYNKLLEQRNALLKSGQSASSILSLMEVYNEKMAPLAQHIFIQRSEFIEELKPIFIRLYGQIAQAEEIAEMEYVSQLLTGDFIEKCNKSLEKDLILKRSSTGIHKDDVHFTINGNAISNFASQGQLKSLVLAFKLAQFVYLKKKTDTTPVILLDDVFDKLDRDRVSHLVGLLFEEQLGQVFITDTDQQRILETFEKIDHAFYWFKIKDGSVLETNSEVVQIGKK
jgi:DNA replication and repair protein RecF